MTLPLRSLRPAGLPGSRADDQPDLRVVPTRRRVAWVAMLLIVAVTGLMLGAAYLHTLISERQLEIDRLDEALAAAHADFDVLRAERSVLRSPTRLADEASALGMIPGRESQFVEIDPHVLAAVIAQTGQLPGSSDLAPTRFTRLDPLDQFRLVKRASQETP